MRLKGNKAMLITTRGIVLREKQVGENDKFIDVLTNDLGVIEISAKGARKINAKNSPASQLFAYSKFCVQKRGERYYLNSSDPIHIFYDLRLDMEKLALASYFAEIILFSATSEEPSQEILRLMLNSLEFLSSGKRSKEFLKSVFELRLLSEIGLMPDIVGCAECGAYLSDKMYFIFENGIILCPTCYDLNLHAEAAQLSLPLLHAIRYIVLTEFEKLWNFKISDEVQKKLNYIAEKYLVLHLDKHFKTLEFYKSICSKEF